MSCLSVQNLSVSYKTKEGENSVLGGVSLQLNQGDFVCLCGPNGCGKSTLLSVIAGVPSNKLKISDGKVEIDSIDIKSLRSSDRAKLLAYMQQSEFSTWDFTVKDFVLQGCFANSNGGHYTEQDYNLVSEILQELGLIAFSERTVHTLSGGEFQKVRIARAFAQQPLFMLLDEPAASLDFVYEPQLLTLLKDFAKRKNIGILLTIHDINIAYRYAEKIMLLPPKMNVIEGKSDAIMTPENLKTTFGVDFECLEIKSFQLLQ